MLYCSTPISTQHYQLRVLQSKYQKIHQADGYSDAIGVGVMLDIARVLIDRNVPFDNSVIFCKFPETTVANISVERCRGCVSVSKSSTHYIETLQDGSHLYSTQHETAKE